jgi:hypothetical protein
MGVAPVQLRGEKLAAGLLTIAKNVAAADTICVSVGLRPLLATSPASGRCPFLACRLLDRSAVLVQSDSTFGLVAAYG